MRLVKLALGIVAVGILQVVAGFFIWQYGVTNGNGTAELAINIPWLVAMAAHSGLFWRSGYFSTKQRWARYVAMLAISLVASCISTLWMLTICANKFGT